MARSRPCACCTEFCRPLEKGVRIMAIIYTVCAILWALYALIIFAQLEAAGITKELPKIIYGVSAMDVMVGVVAFIAGVLLIFAALTKNLLKTWLAIAGNITSDLLVLSEATIAVALLPQDLWTMYLWFATVKILPSIYFYWVLIIFIKYLKKNRQQEFPLLPIAGFVSQPLENGAGYEMKPYPFTGLQTGPKKSGTKSIAPTTSKISKTSKLPF